MLRGFEGKRYPRRKATDPSSSIWARSIHACIIAGSNPSMPSIARMEGEAEVVDSPMCCATRIKIQDTDDSIAVHIHFASWQTQQSPCPVLPESNPEMLTCPSAFTSQARFGFHSDGKITHVSRNNSTGAGAELKVTQSQFAVPIHLSRECH